MRLEQPLWLLLILPIIAALFVWARELLGRSASMYYPEAGHLPIQSSGTWIRWTPTLMRTAALILAAGAMARPLAP